MATNPSVIRHRTRLASQKATETVCTTSSSVEINQPAVKKPIGGPQSSLSSTSLTREREQNERTAAAKKALFEEIVDDFLFARELSRLKPTENLSRTEIEETCSEIFHNKIYFGEAGRLLKELEAKAKTQVEMWTERHEELKKASAAQAELEKALDVFKRLHWSLKSANINGRVLSSTVHKRKRDEALEHMEKASRTMKRMK